MSTHHASNQPGVGRVGKGEAHVEEPRHARGRRLVDEALGVVQGELGVVAEARSLLRRRLDVASVEGVDKVKTGRGCDELPLFVVLRGGQAARVRVRLQASARTDPWHGGGGASSPQGGTRVSMSKAMFKRGQFLPLKPRCQL